MSNEIRISDGLEALLAAASAKREEEVMLAAEILPQYVTAPSAAEYRRIDQQVDALARSWDRMIRKLERWTDEAHALEAATDLYGEA